MSEKNAGTPDLSNSNTREWWTLLLQGFFNCTISGANGLGNNSSSDKMRSNDDLLLDFFDYHGYNDNARWDLAVINTNFINIQLDMINVMLKHVLLKQILI